MKLELRKRKNPSLRKLTKTDSEGTSLNGDPLYVLLEEAEGNVSEEGSTITPEVVDKINWKDETSIEFSVLKDDQLPSPKSGSVLIAAKPDGEIWAIPSEGDSYPLGITTSQFLQKTGTQYAKNVSLSYFNLNKELKMFSTRTRLGAIPMRDTENSNFEDGTYIEFKGDGRIYYYINGTVVQEITPEKLKLTHHTGKIVLTTKISKEDEGTEMILESGGKFSLETPNTKIQETKDMLKFNCFTNLSEASYGNQNFRLQFYKDYVRLQDVSRDKEVFKIDHEGLLCVNGTTRVVDESIVDQYIKNYFDNHFENYCKTYVENDINTQFDNYLSTQFDNYFNTYFENHFDNLFEKSYLNYYNKYFHNSLVFSGAETEFGINVLEDSIFQLYFSETEDSERHIFVFNGLDVASSEISMVINSITYRINQYIADDEQYGDYVEVCKYDTNGKYLGNALIREIYRAPKK